MGRDIKITAKENATYGAQDETKTFDSALKRGHSVIRIDSNKSKEKEDILADAGKKQELMDFIFGSTDKNPLEEVNNKYDIEKEKLGGKKYKGIGIVSIYDKDHVKDL